MNHTHKRYFPGLKKKDTKFQGRMMRKDYI